MRIYDKFINLYLRDTKLDAVSEKACMVAEQLNSLFEDFANEFGTRMSQPQVVELREKAQEIKNIIGFVGKVPIKVAIGTKKY